MKKGDIVATFFDQYTLLDQIGQGGNGKIFTAKDSNSSLVAIKFLYKGDSKEKIKRFKNEMDFCYNSKHKNILKVIDFGTYVIHEEQIHFYVMPLYKSSLRELMNVNGFDGKELDYIKAILYGLIYAHDLGIIHRDIKPENILINSNVDIVIADFGIAKFSLEQQKTEIETKLGSRMANFHYSAPEQKTKGFIVDHRADIYAVGLIINEIFTGTVPIGTDYKTISKVYPQYEYLDSIVNKMIKQSPNDRYKNINEILKDIKIKEQIQAQTLKIKVLENEDIEYISEFSVLNEPPYITGVDWNDNLLTIELSSEVNRKWKQAFHDLGSYHSILGHEPKTFSFTGNKVTHKCEGRLAQNILDYFKAWLPDVTKSYNQSVENDRKRIEAAEVKRISDAIKQEEERKLLLGKLKF